MIEGVQVVNILSHNDERGYFREVFRFSEMFPDISIGQLSHSMAKAGVVKGWHGHKYQSQWNYLVCGKLKVALYDNRPSSPSYQEKMELAIDNSKGLIGYFFPPGVLHGYRCIEGPMNIIYVTSGTYDLDDEIRIDINKYSIPFLLSN